MGFEKRGEILLQNIIFVILNLLFLVVLILFVTSRANSAHVLEEGYAKQIALLIDAANPPMLIKLNMEKARRVAEKNDIPFSEVVRIRGNVVTVRLDSGEGYSYSFFNNVDVGNPYPDGDFYIFPISAKE